MVAWIVGDPGEGEDREEAELRTLKELLEVQGRTSNPALVSWEAQCLIRYLLLARDAMRIEVEEMVVAMGWRPRENVHEEGVDYRYEEGVLVPLVPREEQVPISWPGWPTSAVREGE